VAQETDDAIVPWIQGFVEHQGLAAVQQLLKDVGEVPIVSQFPSVTKTTPAEESLAAKAPPVKSVRWLPTNPPTPSIQLLPLAAANQTKVPLVLAEGVESVEGDDEIAPPDKIDWDKAFP
jgi:hypothetical protein